MSGQTGIVYQIDIEKNCQGESWTNVYYVRRADRQAAVNDAGVIASIEASLYSSDVTVSRARVNARDTTGYDGVLTEIGIVGEGGGVGKMPLFVCQRVVFNQLTGRPSVKYLRSTFGEAQLSDRFTIGQAAIDYVEENYCAPLLALTSLCGNDGIPFSTIQPSRKVAEHQLRRGSKRKATPVLG